jgi:predicted transposase YbfD/YdcC
MQIESIKTAKKAHETLRKVSHHFDGVKDFRMIKKCTHKLSDILFIGLLTCLSNGEDYEDMVLFAKTNLPLLKEYIALPCGVPSHDTFRRVFMTLEPDMLRICLSDYGKDVVGILSEKQICIDGKKLKGVSPCTRGNKGLHILNALVAENRICVGQERVDDRSNEITAIPVLLNQLDITGAVVSIDAIGCQRTIARQIVEKKGDYLLSVKANQRELYEDIVCGFKACTPESVSETWEYDHGRYETRKCIIISSEKALLAENQDNWCKLKTLIKVEASRVIKEKETAETRYYISSETGQKANYFNSLVRGHWAIENQLHWHLDVTFREDASRIRTGHAPENLSTLRKLALQLVGNRNDKLSLKKRRMKAAYDEKYLRELIG